MNFLKHVMQQLDDHSLGLLGAVLGENECKVRDGAKSAVPKIIEAMASAAKADQGLDMLWRELRDTDVTVASDFSKQMYYKDSQALVTTGYDQLDGLIGADTSRLVRSVSREADIGSTSAKRLVCAVTPLVFATVANHQQSKQLNQSELGAVIGQQERHLSNWQRHSDQFLHGLPKNEDENETLFKALPPGGGSALTATAIGSATLGMHHFTSRDNDQDQQGAADQQNESGVKDTDSNNRGRAAAYGGQTQSRLEKANKKDLADTPGGVEVSDEEKEFDQRSHDRRHRKPIAANPANSGFAANEPDHNQASHDQPSKAAVAGSIAAAGAGAAAVAAAALSPSAKSTAGDSSTSSNVANSNLANTYDSENAVSGFAAAGNSNDSGTSDTSGITKPNEGDAEFDSGGKQWWTPDSAKGQRDADGTLRYPHRDEDAVTTTANTASNTSAPVNQSNASEGWFHWLWWPVLILGSLLAFCLMFLSPDGNSSQSTDQDLSPAVASASDGESSSSDAVETTDATALVADGEKPEDSETASGESISDATSSSIQITPSESDATTSDATTSDATTSDAATSDAAAKADDPSKELTMDLAPADPSNEGDSDSASSTKDSGDPMPNTTGKTAGEPNTAKSNAPESLTSSEDQDAMSSLEGSLEASGADGASDADQSVGDNDNSRNTDTDSPELNTTDLELDADEQVEELLSAIETDLDGISNEAQSETAEESLSQHISTLEKVLANRAQWKDEIEVLVDFQLEEGKKMLVQAKEKAFQLETVKKTLGGKFKELNALMETNKKSP